MISTKFLEIIRSWDSQQTSKITFPLQNSDEYLISKNSEVFS